MIDRINSPSSVDVMFGQWSTFEINFLFLICIIIAKVLLYIISAITWAFIDIYGLMLFHNLSTFESNFLFVICVIITKVLFFFSNKLSIWPRNWVHVQLFFVLYNLYPFEKISSTIMVQSYLKCFWHFHHLPYNIIHCAAAKIRVYFSTSYLGKDLSL